MKIKLYFILIFLISSQAAVYSEDVADKNKAAEELIQHYKVALQGDSRAAIREAWEALNKDPKIKEYLEKKYPQVFQSFELQGIAIRLEDLQKQYLAVSGPGGNPEKKPAKLKTAERKNNNNLDLNSSNQRSVSNTKRVQEFPNQDSISNTEHVKNFKNQDSVSNQDLIQHRLKAKQ